VSIADVLGQFAKQFLPPSWAYSSFSDAANKNQAFAQGCAPMPIVLLTEVVPGASPSIGGIMYPGVNSTNLTIYEQTPFEFGSWIGGRVQAFIPIKYLGTKMNNGTPANPARCVTGFDKMSFAQGSTGNAWNFWFIDSFYNIPLFWKRNKAVRRQSSSSTIPIPAFDYTDPEVILVNQTANLFNQTFNQTLWATYPNPFQGYNQSMEGESELLIVRLSHLDPRLYLWLLMKI
jgi:lysophospholipase